MSVSYFTGYTRLYLIQHVLRGLGSKVTTAGTDTTADYSRYPKQDIIDKLNEAQVKFVRETECLKTFCIVEGVASQTMYKLPSRCLEIKEIKYYTGTSAYDRLEALPDMVNLSRVSESWRTDSASTPEYYFPSYVLGNVNMFGVYPKPSSNGTDFGAVDTTYKLCCVSSTDAFNTAYAVPGVGAKSLTGAYGFRIDNDGTETFVFSYESGYILDFSPKAYNMLVDFVMRPLSLSSDTQYPEINPDYHEALENYAIWKLGLCEYNGLQMKEKALEAKESWLEAIDDYRNHQNIPVTTPRHVDDVASREYE